MIEGPTYSSRIKKLVDTSQALIYLREDGIVHVHFKKNTVLTKELQISLRIVYFDLLKSKSTGFIFSADEGFSITDEARENFNQLPQNGPIAAYALIAQNLAYRLIGNFFRNFYQPKKPFKLFDSVEKAAEWLIANDFVEL